MSRTTTIIWAEKESWGGSEGERDKWIEGIVKERDGKKEKTKIERGCRDKKRGGRKGGGERDEWDKKEERVGTE